MKALALLLLVGCGDPPFTVGDLSAISSDDGSSARSIEKPDSSPPIGSDDGSSPGPIEKPDGRTDAGVDVTPDAAMVVDASQSDALQSDASHEDAPVAVCEVSACGQGCLPVYQAACCKGDGTCGCRNAQMGSWPCN